jgi:hypothetical protein
MAKEIGFWRGSNDLDMDLKCLQVMKHMKPPKKGMAWVSIKNL